MEAHSLETGDGKHLLTPFIVLNMWVTTPGGTGVQQSFHRGLIADSLHIKYFYYDP